MIGLETVSVLVQTKMHSAFLTEHMGKVAHTVLASLSGFPCWEMIEAILSHIRGQLSGFPPPRRGWRCFRRGQRSATLFDLSCTCEGSGNRGLKPSQGQVFLPGMQFLQVSSVADPCIDYCHCDGVPPNVDVPSSGSEAELVQCRKHIKKVNASHEPVVSVNNGRSGNHYVGFGFSIPTLHTAQWFNTNKRREQVHSFVVIPSHNDVVFLVYSEIQ